MLLIVRSICALASYEGNSCAGLLEGFAFPINCDDIDPNTNEPFYDPSNAAGSCNAMAYTENKLLVASTKETYIGSACANIIADTYIPDSRTVDPNFAPLLPPYTLQTIKDIGLHYLFDPMPLSFGGNCITSMRKIFCALTFMDPHPVEDLAAIFGTIYMPSFPHYDLCVDYNEACSDTLLTIIPSLTLNCSSKVSPSLFLYPKEEQAIINLNLGYGDIPLSTPPNLLIDSTYDAPTECPCGFSVPEYLDTEKQLIIYGIYLHDILIIC
jgi:hypothetical protein